MKSLRTGPSQPPAQAQPPPMLAPLLRNQSDYGKPLGMMNLRVQPAFEKWKLVSQMVERADAEGIQVGCHGLTGIKLAYLQLISMRQKLLASHLTDEQKRLCHVAEIAQGHRTVGFELWQSAVRAPAHNQQPNFLPVMTQKPQVVVAHA